MEAGLPKASDAIKISAERTSRFGFLSLTLIGFCLFGNPSPSFHSNQNNPAARVIANLASHGTSIICLGDSLTQGVGASTGHDYPTLLGKELGMPVLNAGMDGDETIDALKRLDSDVLAKDPKLVIVALGANDFLDKQPLKKAFENLDEIVRRIEDWGAMVVVVGIPPGYLGDVLQKDYDRIIQKYHVAFVPKVLEGILTNPCLKSNDNLHPNDEGYELIAKRIRQTVIPLIKEGGTYSD